MARTSVEQDRQGCGTINHQSERSLAEVAVICQTVCFPNGEAGFRMTQQDNVGKCNYIGRLYFFYHTPL